MSDTTTFPIATDPAGIDVAQLQGLLGATYWAHDRSRATIARSLERSRVAYVTGDGRLLAFARVVTDEATYAWLCDVVVDPRHRRRGLARAVVEHLLADPDLAGCRWMLRTRDAHELYRRYGFTEADCMFRPAAAEQRDPCAAAPTDL